MAESQQLQPGPLGGRVDYERLSAWLSGQRWFAAKSRTPTGLEVVEEAVIAEGLSLALLLVQFATGAHDLYQLLLAEEGDTVAFDVLAVPAYARRLLDAINHSREIESARGRFCFRHVAAAAPLGGGGSGPGGGGSGPSGGGSGPGGGGSGPGGGGSGPGGGDSGPSGEPADEPVRAMGAEQSNSSIVFGDRLVLKLFRRLESGINPELELLRFLTSHGYDNIAPLYGWYEYEGDALAATLAIAQRYVREGVDGWELALDEIPREPAAFLGRLEALGVATAKLHSVLSSDAGDPAFSPEESSTELLSLLRATLDEEVERLFAHLPDDPRLEPIAGFEQELRELISRTPQTPGGRRIRIHGDYHLGQTLYTPEGWRLLDFEGEPARPLTVRRGKRSPLRDVASMLRSFSYATSAVALQRGLQAPDGFEAGARQTFLEAYLAEVEPALLPSSRGQLESLLAIFELEKALYELRYELDNRPDWVPIPVAGITRLIQAAGA